MKKILLLIIPFLLLIFSCECNSGSTENTKQITDCDSCGLRAGFLVLDSVYNSELMAPYDVLHHTIFHVTPGLQVFTVSPRNRNITTFEGLQLTTDFTFENSPGIDLLIVPSAYHNMDSDLEDTLLINWVRRTASTAKFVMSLCDGAFLLGKAGLLDGKHATTFPGDRKAFQKMFPNIIVHDSISFVRDGKFITSSGGAKSYDPAMYLSNMLFGSFVTKKVGVGIALDYELEDLDYIQFNPPIYYKTK